MQRRLPAALRGLLLALACTAGLPAIAATEAPAAPAPMSAAHLEKVQALIEAQGLGTIFDEQMRAGRERGKANGGQLLRQVMTRLDPPAEFQAKFQQAYDQYLDDMQPPWKGADVVQVWAELYGPHFTDDELDQLVAFYRSPLGRKEVTVSGQSMSAFSERLMARYQPVMEQATQHFVDRVKSLVAECNCRKP